VTGSLADIRRVLATLDAGVASADGGVLEVSRSVAPSPPRSESAPMAEGDLLRAISIGHDDGLRVAAFLDGRQVSRIVGHIDGVPIVHATVGAAVRERTDGRLHTWRDGVRRSTALYLPSRLTALSARAALSAAGVAMRDTIADLPDGAPVEVHPLSLVERAYHVVQQDREGTEAELATAWDERGDGLLYLDGGIAKNDVVARSSRIVGVVKSHRTLYASGEALRVVLGLGVRERTTAFRITSSRRHPVLSWYLRLRDPSAHGPLWGLVRLEAADAPDETDGARRARLDALSRAVAAETAPLSLPDARWAVMAYGIRDCEQFLSSVLPG
jgi:hypothetical protein